MRSIDSSPNRSAPAPAPLTHAQAMPLAATVGACVELLAGNAPNAVKNRLQAASAPTSVSAAFKNLGPRGVTLGLGPQALALVGKRVFSYTAEEAVRAHPLLGAVHPAARGFVSGAVVGALEGGIFNLLKRLGAMQQVLAGPEAKTCRTALRHIVQQEGARGLLGGSLLNAARTSLAGMGYFGTLSVAHSLWPDAPTIIHGPLSGMAAGAVGAVISNPLDVVLTRRYTQGSANGQLPRARQIFANIWRREGMRGMLRGASAAVLRSGTAGLNYGATQLALVWLTGTKARETG